MYKFQMTFTIVYQEDNPNQIDHLYKMIDKAFRSACGTFGYKMKWCSGDSSIPCLPMDQVVTVSDSILVEKEFHQRRNVRDSVSLFFSIVSILESVGGVSISIEMDTGIVESKKALP